MLERLAMALCALWAAGLVTGNAFGGLIHVLLIAGLTAFFLHWREASRVRAAAQAGAARDMARVMGSPASAAKSKSRGSRPSAAA
jgi:hypothetical protein